MTNIFEGDPRVDQLLKTSGELTLAASSVATSFEPAKDGTVDEDALAAHIESKMEGVRILIGTKLARLEAGAVPGNVIDLLGEDSAIFLDECVAAYQRSIASLVRMNVFAAALGSGLLKDPEGDDEVLDGNGVNTGDVKTFMNGYYTGNVETDILLDARAAGRLDTESVADKLRTIVLAELSMAICTGVINRPADDDARAAFVEACVAFGLERLQSVVDFEKNESSQTVEA